MIQINCTIVNITVAPVLNLANGHDYIAELESDTRAIFKVQDIDHQVIGNFEADDQIVFRDYVVPSNPGSYEGPVLELKPFIQELHISRDQFLLPDGTNYNWKGNIDFMLFKRSLDGQDISPLLAQRFNSGSRAIVTLMMAAFIERFYPSDYGARYLEHIHPFAETLKSKGFYWTPIVFADAQIIIPDKGSQTIFLGKISEQFAGMHWVLPSLCNEYQKNGCDPSIFNKPVGNLWSRGSNLSDSEPYRPGWDWKEWHPRRDWPKVIFGNDDAWYVKEGMDAENHMLDYPMPCIIGEPIGFWDRNVPNRRSNDPNLARVIGGTSIYDARGANFMSEQGLRCDMWDPITENCAKVFFNAINQ